MRGSFIFTGGLPAVLAAAVLSVHCTGTPLSPGSVIWPGIDGTPPPPPPENTPPVIESVTVSASRMEVGEALQLTAIVSDAETAIDQLTFEWSAEAGVFSGQGPSVSWQPPSGAATPANYTFTLTVVESYPAATATGQIATQEHRVTSETVTVRVHDSPRELSDMGLAFLGLFANSSVSPQACLVDFSDNCRGKAEELSDIETNRAHYFILGYTAGAPRVAYQAGSTRAQMWIRTTVDSRILRCLPEAEDCAVGGTESVAFDAYLTSVYEQGRWWLCDSRAIPLGTFAPSMKLFFGRMSPP